MNAALPYKAVETYPGSDTWIPWWRDWRGRWHAVTWRGSPRACFSHAGALALARNNHDWASQPARGTQLELEI